jgi:hypothetical protein
MKSIGLWACLLMLAPGLDAQFSVRDLPVLGNYESERASSYDRSGRNGDYRSLQAGETLTIFDHDGPGEIRHIWTTIPAWSEAYHLKKIVLRMHWDDEKQPSVETPIGDFFGLGLGTYTVFQSALITVNPEQALNSYFPMQRHLAAPVRGPLRYFRGRREPVGFKRRRRARRPDRRTLQCAPGRQIPMALGILQ